jgi:hypothetical protein
MSASIDLKSPLYHGSYTEIMAPDLSFARRATDFGNGFYLTNNREQADEIALDRGDLKNLAYGVNNQYAYSERNTVLCFNFKKADVQWLEFVLFNRDVRSREYVNQTRCRELLATYDIIIGPVADDDLSPTINELIITLQNLPANSSERVERVKSDTISDLRPYRYKYQACFRTPAALDNLIFTRSRNVVK